MLLNFRQKVANIDNNTLVYKQYLQETASNFSAILTASFLKNAFGSLFTKIELVFHMVLVKSLWLHVLHCTINTTHWLSQKICNYSLLICYIRHVEMKLNDVLKSIS